MSETKPVRYAGRGFWAYDISLGVLTKHLLDAAEKSGEAHAPWLSEAMSQWRQWDVISAVGLKFDEHGSAEQRKTVIALMGQACTALGTRRSIPVDEIVSWPFADDVRIFPRAAKEVLTAPVIELGCAMIALLSGQLAEAPKGKAWFFGVPDGDSTIEMDPSWDGRW